MIYPEDIAIFYRMEIYDDLTGERVFASQRRHDFHFLTLPDGILNTNGTYRWRVRVIDDNNWVKVQNRSNSAWSYFTVADTLELPSAKPAVDLDGFGVVTWSTQRGSDVENWVVIIDQDGVAYDGSSHGVSVEFPDGSNYPLQFVRSISPTAAAYEFYNDLHGNTYQVYAGDTYEGFENGYHPEDFGWEYIGTANDTGTFNASRNYQYYVVVTYPQNIAYVDTVEVGGVYYGSNTAGNTNNWQNVGGVPDQLVAEVGGMHDGYGGGFILIQPPAPVGGITVHFYTPPSFQQIQPGEYSFFASDLLGGAAGSATEVLTVNALEPPDEDSFQPSLKNPVSEFITATFDNVYVNGELYENFESYGSIDELNPTKWRNNYNVGIGDGNAVSSLQGFVGRPTGGLGFANANTINSISAEITIDEVSSNDLPRARISGTWCHNGNADVWVSLNVKGDKVDWSVNEQWINEDLTWTWRFPENGDGVLLTGLTPGQTITLGISMTGNILTFTADDGSGPVSDSYTVAGTINPPIHVDKNLWTRINLITDTTPVFSWNAVTGANRYRVKIYNADNSGAIWSGNTEGSGTSYRVPPGVLKPDNYYRYRVEARDAVNPLNIDNVSKTPASNNDNYIFYTDSQQAEAPYIELDKHGVYTWNDDQDGVKLSFWIKVHDAQGVPGDIQSVKVKHPGNTEEELSLFESNPYSPTSATSGIYILDSTLPPVDGKYEFTVLDQAGNSHTVSEDLTADTIAPPQDLQITNIDGTAVSFDWGTVAGAILYSLRIFDNDLNLIYTFHTSDSEYQLAEGFLELGKTYRWSVQAHRELFGNNVDNVSGTPANYQDAIQFNIDLPADSDGDGMPDDWEMEHFGDLTHSDATNSDSDDLNDLQEYQNGTNPLNPDTDGDGLSDSDELYNHNTDPTNPDTDGDGVSDGNEVATGFDPKDPLNFPGTFTGIASLNDSSWSDAEVYGSGEAVYIEVRDIDLDENTGAVDTATVMVTSSVEDTGSPSSVSTPVAGPEAGGPNTGDGTIDEVKTGYATLSETWTVTCTQGGGSARFSVEGSVSGVHLDAVAGLEYTSDYGKVKFLITQGATAFAVNDRFTFSTTAAAVVAEEVTLTETGAGTGVFRGSIAIDDSGSAGLDGNLDVSRTDTVTLIYDDSSDDWGDPVRLLETAIYAASPVSGALGSNTTWSADDSPYLVTGDVTVPSGVTLTIEPGVVVLFFADPDNRLALNVSAGGTLNAAGTLGNPIVFTSSAHEPQPGDWNGIRFYDDMMYGQSASGTLQYCQVEYGVDGIYASWTNDLEIRNSTISNNSQYGIYLESSNATISDNNITSNGNNGIYINSGSFSGAIVSNTVSNHGSYGIRLNYANFSGIINSNIIDRSNSYGIYIYRGNFSGTIDSNIIRNHYSSGIYYYGSSSYSFSGVISANTITNDTGYSGSGIDIRNQSSGSSGSITDNIISGSGYSGTGISCNNILSITGNSVTSHGTGIIYRGSADPAQEISFNTVTGNDWGGIYLSDSVSPALHSNNLYGNGSYDLYNQTGNDIDARNNWWGETTTTDEMQTGANPKNITAIYDSYDEPAYGFVNYSNWRTVEVIFDSDGDQIRDNWEETYFGNLDRDGSLDFDDDELTDLEEFRNHTDPTVADTDSDGIPDGWEVDHLLNPRINDAGSDADSDGLTNSDEYQNDTDPRDSDSDNDGLTDSEELYTYYTDPNLSDSDSDGMPDGWEVDNLLNPDIDDSDLDGDSDGLANLDEYQNSTDPDNPDTDDDGVNDGDEVNTLGTNPNNSDSDGDALSDGEEVANHTDPHNPDTDSDGFQDGSDNCPFIANLSQTDSDSDGAGDVCQGIFAFYPFTGSADDMSGGGNDGTAFGDIALTGDRFGNPDAAYLFDGANDYISIPNIIPESFTVSFWIKTGSDAPNGDHWWQGWGLVDAEICGSGNDGGIAMIDGGRVAFDSKSNTFVNDNEWHSVVATYDGTAGTRKLYIDGVFDFETTRTPGSIWTAAPWIGIGNNSCDVSFNRLWFAGALDDVLFYNRVLSIDELRQLLPDSDSDGMPDGWEMDNFGDLTRDGSTHSDGDGLTDLQEYQNGTNPNNPDTDGDWVNDGDEVNNGTNPNDPAEFTSPGTGAIRGTVRDTDGTPITGTTLSVDIYSNAQCGANWLTRVAVDESNGRYILIDLAPGEYYADTNNLNLSNYVNEWWASFGSQIDCRNAQAITVSADGLVNNVDFQLDLGGEISGTITDSATGQIMIENVWVNAHNDFKKSGVAASTDANGNYTLRGIPAGCIDVWAYPPSASDYIISAEQIIDLDENDSRTGVDFALDSGALSISGTVSSDGTPLTGVGVGFENEALDIHQHATTDSSGYFQLTNLLPGGAVVNVEPQGTDREFAARVIDNLTGPLTGFDFNLAVGACVSGRVVDESGNGLPDILVWVEPEPNETELEGQTDADGNFSVCNLPEGIAYMGAESDSGDGYCESAERMIYVTGEVDNPTEPITLRSCTLVQGAFNNPGPSQHCFDIGDVDIWAEGVDFESGADVEPDGSYRILLPDGIHSLYFEMDDEEVPYNFVSFPAQVTIANGTVETPPGPMEVIYEEHSKAAEISGSIIDARADPADPTDPVPTGKFLLGLLLPGSFEDITPEKLASTGSIQEIELNGFAGSAMVPYHLKPVPPGRYDVFWVLDNEESSEPSFESFTVRGLVRGIEVLDTGEIQDSTGATISAINFDYTAAGSQHVHGYVYDNAGNPMLGAEVLITKSGTLAAFSETDETGHWEVYNLPPGDYTIAASHWFFESDPVDSKLENISISAGAETEIDNLTLNIPASTPGSIEGRVTSDSDDGIPGLWVTAHHYDTGQWMGNAQTQTYGSYTITGLPAGRYRVDVNTGGTDYIQEYFDNTYDWGSAIPVIVDPGQATPNINFELQVGGTISGHVFQDDNITAIANVCVNAFADPCHQNHYKGTQTDASGYYEIRGLPPDPSVYVRFDGNCSGGNYIQEWYDGQYDCNNAQPVAVSASGVNATLDVGASISGTVTDSGGGVITDVQISVHAHGINPNSSSLGNHASQTDGRYTINGLAPGTYKIQANNNWEPGYVSKYFDDKPSYDTADEVFVAAGQSVTGKDFILEAGGTISGTVTRQDNSDPIEGAQVIVYDSNWQWLFDTRTNSAGNYGFGGFLSGSYYVKVSGWGDFAGGWQHIYIEQHFNGSMDRDGADLVTVTVGVDTPNIDFTLQEGGTISGFVFSDSNGQPIKGVSVQIRNSDTYAFSGSSETQADGSYTLKGLSTGTYFLLAKPPGTGYAAEFYNDTYEDFNAERIYIAAGDTKTNINFSLDEGGAISGTVLNPSGQPVPDTWVSVSDYHNGSWFGNAWTGSDGSYLLGGLPPGDYRVEVDPWGTPYLREYYNNAFNWDNAIPVTVIPNVVTTDTHFDLDLGGVISGKVLDLQTNNPVEDKSVGSVDLNVGWHKLVYRQTADEYGAASRAAFRAPGDTGWRIFSTSELDIRTAPDGAQTGVLLANKRNTCSNLWPNTHARLVKCVDTEASSEDGWYGESIVDRIYHDENIHGNSDFYTSYYEAYFYVDSEGTWLFSTDSNDASEIEIDGSVVAAWYGGHGTAGRWENKFIWLYRKPK